MGCDCKYHQDANQMEGRYANYFQVGHNAFEFLLDFGQSYLEGGSARYHTRIVTSTAYAKTLLVILQGSIDRYEQNFGGIPEDDEQEPSQGQVDGDDD